MHCVWHGKQGKGDWVWCMGAGMEHKLSPLLSAAARSQGGTAQTCPRAEVGPRASVWNVNILPAREKAPSYSPRAGEVNIWQGNRGMINMEVQPCRVGWGSCSGVRGHQGWVTPKPRLPAGSSGAGGSDPMSTTSSPCPRVISGSSPSPAAFSHLG